MGELTLTVDQFTAQFLLELLHTFGERRLRDVAHLRGTREVQRACESQKIPNLMKLHWMVTASLLSTPWRAGPMPPETRVPLVRT